MFKKIIAWLVVAWKAIWVNLWAAITTEGKTIESWNLDPFKIGGLVLFGVAIWLTFVTVGLAQAGKDSTTVGIIAGLVVTIGGYGTFLFQQAKSNDASIRGQGQ